MEDLIKNFLTIAVENNRTTYDLKKGVEPVYCSAMNSEGDHCQNDAYWRWGEEDYCDRHLPLEGRILFLLNEWKTTKDDEYEFESDSESESSESDTDASSSSDSCSESSDDSNSLPELTESSDESSDSPEFSDQVDLGSDIEIKSEPDSFDSSDEMNKVD